jgi:hypothetical protein
MDFLNYREIVNVETYPGNVKKSFLFVRKLFRVNGTSGEKHLEAFERRNGRKL